MAAREQLSGPIKIPDPATATTPVLKARAYEPGALPSEPARERLYSASSGPSALHSVA